MSGSLFFISYESIRVAGKLERECMKANGKLWQGAEDGRLYGQQRFHYCFPTTLKRERGTLKRLSPFCDHRAFVLVLTDNINGIPYQRAQYIVLTVS